MKELILIYELDQMEPVCERYQRAAIKPRVVSLNFWVERELTQQHIPFESFSSVKLSDGEAAAWLARARTIAREWYRLPELAFFNYKGIRLAEAIEPALDSYLQILFYYLAPLERLLAQMPDATRIIVPNKSGRVAPTAGLFSLYEANAVVDVIRYLAASRNIAVETIGLPPTGTPQPFPSQPLSRVFISLWNTIARTLAPRRPIKIFASETWGHIAPFIGTMDDAELVLMDRSEALNIPRRQLWGHRMRFIHPLTWQSPWRVARARALVRAFAPQWQAAKPVVEAMPTLSYDGHTLWPLILPALDWFVGEYAARPIYEAMSFERMFKQEHITKVLLRVSVSMHQSHFFIASKVAHKLGIPTIELQHAGAVLDTESAHSRLEADYLAAYGSLTADIYAKNHGIERTRLRAIGSPRFDRYLYKSVLSEEARAQAVRAIGFDPKRPVVLVATASDNTVLIPHEFDSYDIAHLFEAVKRLQGVVPGVQIIFKFRSYCPPSHRVYVEEIFNGKDVAIATDDLYYRIQMSDTVLSSNSTAMYEVMMAHKPLVLYPWRTTDVVPLEVYGRAAKVVFDDVALAAEVSRLSNDASYRVERIKQQDAFLQDNYSFDGQAANRTKALLHEDLSLQD